MTRHRRINREELRQLRADARIVADVNLIFDLARYPARAELLQPAMLAIRSTDAEPSIFVFSTGAIAVPADEAIEFAQEVVAYADRANVVRPTLPLPPALIPCPVHATGCATVHIVRNLRNDGQ